MMQKTDSYQNAYLSALQRDGTPVTVFLVNGFQMRGVITGYDAFVIVLHAEGRRQMVYKHAISTIAMPGQA